MDKASQKIAVYRTAGEEYFKFMAVLANGEREGSILLPFTFGIGWTIAKYDSGRKTLLLTNHYEAPVPASEDAIKTVPIGEREMHSDCSPKRPDKELSVLETMVISLEELGKGVAKHEEKVKQHLGRFYEAVLGKLESADYDECQELLKTAPRFWK